MLIYKISNIVNSKVYIGQTITSLKKRWNAHLQRARTQENKPLYNAINKYGINNFIIEIIDSAFTIDDLNKREQEWIKGYGSLNPNGYNLQTGGLNSSACEMTKKKISILKTGAKYPNRKSAVFSDTHKKNISKSLKNSMEFQKAVKSKERNDKIQEKRKSYVCLEETKEKMRKNHKGNTGRKFTDEHKRKIGEANKKIQEQIKLNKLKVV